VPIPIPIGGIVNVKSDNPLVDIEDNRITVKSDYVKMTENGEEVAIMDIHVTGRRIGESATISAKIGKYNTEMKVNVIEAELGGVSRKPKYPRVLLSGQDADPLGLDKTVFLSPRHNLVYQRFEDVKEGIYWINTQSPLAVSILDKFGVHSPRWREYLFQRYIEIFMKEALYELQKKDPEAFRADRIDNDIMGELVRKIHSAAAEDLGQFLFNDDYDLGVSEKSKEEN
jgi:hypothetical protein